MASGDEDYVYAEASGEWMPVSEHARRREAENAVEVRDAVGNRHRRWRSGHGDQGSRGQGRGQTLKRGALIKSIRPTGDPQEIDCKFDGIKGLVLRAEFVRKH